MSFSVGEPRLVERSRAACAQVSFPSHVEADRPRGEPTLPRATISCVALQHHVASGSQTPARKRRPPRRERASFFCVAGSPVGIAVRFSGHACPDARPARPDVSRLETRQRDKHGLREVKRSPPHAFSPPQPFGATGAGALMNCRMRGGRTVTTSPAFMPALTRAEVSVVTVPVWTPMVARSCISSE